MRIWDWALPESSSHDNDCTLGLEYWPFALLAGGALGALMSAS